MNLAIKVDNQDKEEKNKINGLGIMKDGKYQRCVIGPSIFSTYDYSAKFKNTDCYFRKQEFYYEIIELRYVDTGLNIYCKKIYAKRVNIHLVKVLGFENPDIISASLELKKLVCIKFNSNIYLSDIPYEIFYK